jgi:hypothetical protein
VVDKLKKENTELKQKMMCVICKIKDFDYVIKPCCNLTCDVCPELDICICNSHVTSKHVCILSREVLHINLFQLTILWNDYGKCWEALVRVFLLCC